LRIQVQNIRRSDDGIILLEISLGQQPPRIFRASYDEGGCGFDTELFFALSNAAYRRFGNCIVYQHELFRIVQAFCTGKELPPLPATLGTTHFCTFRPMLVRVVWNKLLIFLRWIHLYHPPVWVRETPSVPQ
jgi:hypothetical protein